jgi:hypothetical protein
VTGSDHTTEISCAAARETLLGVGSDLSSVAALGMAVIALRPEKMPSDATGVALGGESAFEAVDGVPPCGIIKDNVALFQERLRERTEVLKAKMSKAAAACDRVKRASR